MKRLLAGLLALLLSSCSSPQDVSTVVPPNPDDSVPAQFASHIVLIPNQIPQMRQVGSGSSNINRNSVDIYFSHAPRVGDELVCAYSASTSLSDIYSVPANWTGFYSNTHNGLTVLGIEHTVVMGDTAGPYTLNVSGSDVPTGFSASCGDFSGVNTSNPIASIAPLNTMSSTGSLAQSLSLAAPVLGAIPVGFFSAKGQVSATVAAPFSLATQNQSTGITKVTSATVVVAFARNTSTSYTPTVTWSALVNASNGFLVMLTPAGVSVGSTMATPAPTGSPTPLPTGVVTSSPSPTASPTSTPTVAPTASPTPHPTASPTPTPTPTAPPVATPTPTAAPTATPTPNCTVGGFTAPSAYPDACFHPYASNSVWNTPISSYSPAPSPDPNSSTYMSYYASNFSIFTSLQFGYTNESNQFQHPVYFGHSSDPVYSITCTGGYSPCSPGVSFHIPSYAIPAEGGDRHFTDIDESNSSLELDCWNTNNLSGTGGTLTATACGTGPLTGPGIVFGQTGAGFAQWAGVIRAQELIAGNIPHALFIVMPCTNNNAPVYPSNYRSTDTECTGNQGAPYGAFFRLNMTDAQITALGVPTWKKAIYTALAHYGGFVGDTNGNNAMNVQFEADEMYTRAGYTNPNCPSGRPCTPLTAYFHTLGDPGWTGSVYNVNLSEVNWATYGQWLLPPPS